MTYQPARTMFGLIAVGGAVAVGLATHDVGFTALTFIGGLMLPRILGFRGHRHGLACMTGRGDGGGMPGRGRFEHRMDSWHRQAHQGTAGEQSPAGDPAGA